MSTTPRKGWARILREHGAVHTLQRFLRRRGINVFRYWWVLERLPARPSDALGELPEGFSYRGLSEGDLEELLTFPARGAPMEAHHLTEAFARGDGCLGVLRGEEIVGFGFWSLDAAHSNVYHATSLAPNEAYLHNMYVLPELRGHRLAPSLRYRTYLLLAELGRDTFYSITALSNLQSWRFKEKLGAEKLSLHWYLGIRGRWHVRVRLRRYTPPPLQGTCESTSPP